MGGQREGVKSLDCQRNIKNLPASNCAGYGTLIGMGYDTVVETFNADVSPELWARLDHQKKLAQAGDERGKDVAAFGLGSVAMQIKSHGGRRGTPFILTCPDFDIDFRSPKTQWNISVRYSAAGLWQYGVDALRERAHKAILSECSPRSEGNNRWVQVSSVHYAFDFYSPKFSADMTPAIFSQFICHSSSKKRTDFKFKNFSERHGSAWGRAGYLETFTLGSRANLEVQVYDKGKEIVEASGKEWMLKVWENEGYYPPDDKKYKNVWRLELRYGKEYLDARDIKDFEDFDRMLPEICAEGIYTKRLTQDNGDRIRRRPLHPLWAMAAIAIGSPETMPAIGKQDTSAREEKARQLEKQMAGLARNVLYLRENRVDTVDMVVLARSMHETIFEDDKHQEKVEKIERRYTNIGRAR